MESTINGIKERAAAIFGDDIAIIKAESYIASFGCVEITVRLKSGEYCVYEVYDNPIEAKILSKCYSPANDEKFESVKGAKV